jgi:hypothetical protein
MSDHPAPGHPVSPTPRTAAAACSALSPTEGPCSAYNNDGGSTSVPNTGATSAVTPMASVAASPGVGHEGARCMAVLSPGTGVGAWEGVEGTREMAEAMPAGGTSMQGQEGASQAQDGVRWSAPNMPLPRTRPTCTVLEIDRAQQHQAPPTSAPPAFYSSYFLLLKAAVT